MKSISVCIEMLSVRFWFILVDKAKDTRSGATVALKRVKMHNEKNGKMCKKLKKKDFA